MTLPSYHHENEGDYNTKLPAEQSGYHCMDRDMIYHGGTHGQVEFCDLITDDKNIIHVKRYGGSSVLSHLFAQGLVSGELFLADNEFREKVNTKLPATLKLTDTTTKPIPSDYNVIFAIISEADGNLEIPFFSKVSFRNTKRRLETFGYNVAIVKIEVEK